MKNIEQKLKNSIIALAKKRGPDKTICPSEAARNVDTENWQSLMEATRSAAHTLQKSNRITIEQDGKTVDLNEVSGPIRLRINLGQSDS